MKTTDQPFVVEQCFDNFIPEFKRESGIGGWNYFISERLSAFINKAINNNMSFLKLC